ncbi:D-amino acid dehydrogenase [Oricola cellulosilytica]|uniref:D-amino acid dehydrogenase n=1 Tax=Oricola cellulosilytica TaxID=1429082 RepID=A0A4R0P9D3_9HYPH|nr:D-amino acid dehydrogenase [Oricola cellulosilytica]TCD13780.1 D-amino acid dehydrogenase [Oricola cellulosilytica]
MTRIAIIGAGITGTTTAWSLIRRGYDVTLFDRQRYAAMETSFANGGQLSASNAEVWMHWATILKGLRWMFRKDAPLLFHPAPTWHKLSWITEFVASIPQYERNTVETVRLAIAAREHIWRMAAEAGIAFDHEKRGILHIYRDRAGFEHATRVNRLLEKGGLVRRAVGPAEMRVIEPTLTGNLHAGYFTESDSTGDIHKFAVGLADAVARCGGRFETGTTVHRLSRDDAGVTVRFERSGETREERFDGVVVAAGIASRRFAAQLGDRVNIYPVKGYSITVNLRDAASRAAAPWTSLLDDDAKIVTSRLGADRFRIAGTAEFTGENRDIRSARIRPLVNWCETLFPGVDTASVVPWAGLRPMMPNMMPRVGRGAKPRIFYNTGHGHLGWTLSPATADAVAALIGNDLPADGIFRARGDLLEAA